MNIKERFIKFFNAYEMGGVADFYSDELEKISDRYNIEFYNWMQDNYFQVGDGFVMDRNIDESKRVIITTENALLKFKEWKTNGKY